jgi:hypothetical protein
MNADYLTIGFHVRAGYGKWALALCSESQAWVTIIAA